MLARGIQIYDQYFLIAILDNDYIDSHLLDIFDDAKEVLRNKSRSCSDDGMLEF